MINIMKALSSFKLALFLLVSTMILVVMGTVFQSHSEVTDVQEKFFRAFFVYLDLPSLKMPIFPGGYLLGSLLILNLLCALLLNSHLHWSKLGIYLIHLGVVLLLVGETLGGIYSSETFLPLTIGEKKNYSMKEEGSQLSYFPFSIELTEFKHEKYAGTDIPKSFSSSVQIHNHKGKVIRRAFISMNNPLRYQGYTFYQAGFGKEGQQSILKVVKNPAFLSPYLFSLFVIFGFIYQFTYQYYANYFKDKASRKVSRPRKIGFFGQ